MHEIIGIAKYSYPSQFDPRGYANIKVVLVAGDVNDYAAYIGQGEPEWIADHGDKLSFNQAQGHFPGIDEKRYRL